MVASTLDAPFNFPEATSTSTVNVWEDIIKPHLPEIMSHDITDLKVTREAIETGRIRSIKEGKQFAPTLMKSQSQSTKDSVTVEYEGRHYKLPLNVQSALNGLPASFDHDYIAKDKAEQIIGQSICCTRHHKVMVAVREHIKGFIKKTMAPSVEFNQGTFNF
jgi:hypothetical protein